MTPTRRHRVYNFLHSALLIGGMGLIVWAVVGMMAGPALTFLIVAGAMLGLVLTPALPRRLLLSSYKARRLSGREFPEGIVMMADLARRAGLPRVPELYYVPSRLPNAFAVGAPEESAVCVTDGLLRLLDRRELQGVLAHEVAHISHRDLWIMGLADAMSRIVSLASWIGQLILLLNLPLFLTGAAYLPWHILLLLAFSPLLMALLQLALSRSREYDADRAAAELTGDPAGLARALLKLERRVGRFWEEMFLPGRRIPEPSLLRTHPPTEDRVARLRSLPQRSRPADPAHDVLSVPPASNPGVPRFRGFGHYW
ncbi:zinc metalloprotease HtpX [Salinicola sp. 4072]|uniref:zinc metalloprotease HtpX n=1 Tax=Salinicola TaxID=404432 RepID=UPI000B400B84|nr:zinc metalloprotease HtpX [Salinicola salarius]